MDYSDNKKTITDYMRKYRSNPENRYKEKRRSFIRYCLKNKTVPKPKNIELYNITKEEMELFVNNIISFTI